MKKLSFILLAVVFVVVAFAAFQQPTVSFDERWKKVEELAEKQLPESALKEVDAILKDAKKQNNSPEIIKATLYKMRFTLEKDPDQAPQLIKEFETFATSTSDTAEKSLLYSMTAELYAQYFQQKAYSIRQRTEISDYVPENIDEWTKNIFFDKVSQLLAASLEPAEMLQKTDIHKFETILEKGDSSHRVQPTLFDFLAYRRIDILQSLEGAQSIKNPLKSEDLFSDLSHFVSLLLDTTYSKSVENQVLQTYQQLLSFHLKDNNVPALLYADLQRLTYLKENSQLSNSDELYLSALARLSEQYANNENVVEVMAAMAQYYLDKEYELEENMNFAKKAYAICSEGIRRFPDYPRIALLKNIQQQITQKSVSLRHSDVVRSKSQLSLYISTKNVEDLQMQIYRVNASSLDYFSFTKNPRNSGKDFPDRTLWQTSEIKIKPDTNFVAVDTVLKIPSGTYGIYEVQLTIKGDTSSEVARSSYVVSDLSFMVRQNEPKKTALYVLNSETGWQQKEVKVSLYEQKWTGNFYQMNLLQTAVTDKNGFCTFPYNNQGTKWIFLEKGEDRYFSSSVNTYYWERDTNKEKPVQLEFFTDRAVYRPGQTVYFKGIAYYADAKRQEVAKSLKFDVSLIDTHYQKIASKTFTTNKFGSFAGEFVLPADGLNGTFRLESGNFSKTIWVEEYKRPTFEVKIQKPTDEVKFGEKVTLTGNVKAYSGYNIADAKVNFRVVRRPHWYCSWIRSEEKAISNGETKTDANGNFTLFFIPEKSKENFSFRKDAYYVYTVYAEVTDTKGETQQGQQFVAVGDKSLFILADVPEKWNKKEKADFPLRLETINGEKVDGTVQFTVYRFENSEDFATNEKWAEMEEEGEEEISMKSAKKIMEGTFNTKDGKLKLDVNKWESGGYRIVFSTLDQSGKKVELGKNFILYGKNDKRPSIQTMTWLPVEEITCEVGETAEVVFGSSADNVAVLYEMMQGNTVLESKWIRMNNEIKTFPIPFKAEYGDGITVMFTFMKKGLFFTESVIIRRKIAEKKLTPTLTVFRNKLLPGEKAEWTVNIPEIKQIKKQAELLMDMYDASLDVIRPNEWTFQPIFRGNFMESPRWDAPYNRIISDNIDIPVKYIPVEEYRLDRLNWFGLDLMAGQKYNGPFVVRGLKSLSATSEFREISAMNEKFEEETVVAFSVVKTVKTDLTNVIMQPETSPVIRKNFNETAFFYPQLYTDSAGDVKFSFTAPESLTRWNIKMLAHTPDLYFGQADAQAITQQDLMIQMNLPRFVRCSDTLILSCIITNLSEKEISPVAHFELLDAANEQPVAVFEDSKVQLSPNETKTVRWQLKDFSSHELLICKVMATAGSFSDGEQNYLPVLPDKILVTESLPMTVRGHQTKTFQFESLQKKFSQVETKNLTLEFAAQPVWYAIQALPTLAEPENQNAVDYFAAYYVSTLAAYIVQSYPEIEKIFRRWEKSETGKNALLSNLEKNSELKNFLLKETPWLMAAQDEMEQKNRLALLFDLNMQQDKSQQYLDKLLKLQLSTGAFTWFEGMTENRYITQLVLLNMKRLHEKTGLPMDKRLESAMTLALNYLDKEIVNDFEQLKKNRKNFEKENCISPLQLQYLYLRSSYSEIPVPDFSQEAVKFYRHQAEKFWTDFSLYGKSQAAIVAYRDGKMALARNILKSLKENALKSEEMGMYWANNKAGYFWNERPVAVQTAIMEAFSEIGADTSDLEEMKTWLLKQKQTQRWDSPISTVDAVFALLTIGNNWLQNNDKVIIKIGDKELQPSSIEAGSGYFKQSLPVEQITSASSRITVSKNSDGIGWGAMYWQYLQKMDQVQSTVGALNISKKLFVEKVTSAGRTLVPIEQVKISLGDKVVTRLVVTTDRNLEFVALKDIRAAGLEPVNQISGCQWKQGVCYYQTIKDASAEFFFSSLPKGTYVFEYALWANNVGTFNGGTASIQCQYAPEFVGYAAGQQVVVQ
ncbi:MAG TPA: alpha-2-macroglobulin family protein [Paludibacteraceae bacterium]|nr:alpha-2-macroglobulin family protein [Paludibacteraceae bacterium]